MELSFRPRPLDIQPNRKSERWIPCQARNPAAVPVGQSKRVHAVGTMLCIGLTTRRARSPVEATFRQIAERSCRGRPAARWISSGNAIPCDLPHAKRGFDENNPRQRRAWTPNGRERCAARALPPPAHRKRGAPPPPRLGVGEGREGANALSARHSVKRCTSTLKTPRAMRWAHDPGTFAIQPHEAPAATQDANHSCASHALDA